MLGPLDSAKQPPISCGNGRPRLFRLKIGETLGDGAGVTAGVADGVADGVFAQAGSGFARMPRWS